MEDLTKKIKKTILEMVAVKGGTYLMGSNDDGGYVHQVKISDFYLGKYEVTNEQFCAFLNDYGTDKVKSGEYAGEKMIYNAQTAWSKNYPWGVYKSGNTWYPINGYEKHPVIFVTWYGANEYCNWLSKITGETYRLPTKAEWEYAAGGGNKSNGYKYAGSDNIDEVAWYKGNSGGKTHPVGEKKPNELGIYDMSGNVCEWCYDPSFIPGIGDCRVLAGGSWFFDPGSCRRERDHGYDRPNSYVSIYGFRVIFQISLLNKALLSM